MSKKKKEPTLKFYEKSHIYRLGKQKLTSVTTFLGSYFKKFDADAVAKWKAYKSKSEGFPEQGIKYWKAQWKESSDHGTRVHKALEEFILHGAVQTQVEEDDKLKIDHGLKAIALLPEGVIETEKIIYDGELGLAGTIDLMITKPNGVVDLFDWKTNKLISQEGYRGARAKDPIRHLPDCNFAKYSLQLSTYAYMLEKRGMEIGNLKLVHLTNDEYIVYTIPYLKEDVLKLLRNKTDKENEK